MINVDVFGATLSQIRDIGAHKDLVKLYEEHLEWPAFVGIDDDDHVLFVAGCCLMYHGVAEAWSVLTEQGKRTIAVPRAIRRVLGETMSGCGLWRLQATVTPDLARWIEFQGFEFEGVLRKYANDGTDRLMYSIVR